MPRGTLKKPRLARRVGLATSLVLFIAGFAACEATISNNAIDPTAIPLGDAKYSSSPAVGWVYSCQTQFGGSGAFTNGPWIDEANGTWDSTTKYVVDGAVSWSSTFNLTKNANTRTLTGNGLPDHTTGVYPISPSDDAYTVDRNPNSITARTLNASVPANPTVAASPSCLGMGAIGYTLSGVAIYNGFDAGGNDAVAHEVQDACHGHPQQQGQYHYHDLTPCIDDSGTGHSQLVGYALDGFGIYGSRGENGQTLTNADLDECHGHTHQIEWDGQTVSMYHYHATTEFPYTLGCFKGTR